VKKDWLIILALVGCSFIPIFTSRDNRASDIEIPKRIPQRIISLTLGTTKILSILGAQDQVVAISESKAGIPTNLKDKPRVGRSFGYVNVEAILGFRSDIVFCWENIADILKKKGIPAYVVSCKSIQDVLDIVKEIGRITGRDKSAEDLLVQLKNRIRAVRQKVAMAKARPLVYFEAWGPGHTRAKGTLTHDLITIAGGINIAEDQPVSYPLLTSEYIIQRNPDVIIVEGYNQYGALEIKRRDGWKAIKAVRDNRVFNPPVTYTDWNPECIEGLEQFARWFHPEIFENGN
jgi:iron complex transport system substrate-binding protein